MNYIGVHMLAALFLGRTGEFMCLQFSKPGCKAIEASLVATEDPVGGRAAKGKIHALV